jgi:multiple RNA-binding domain-containing protein 1
MAAPPQQPATSRLCVKNLPKHVDEARLKEHFSSKGEVTDVKIIRTKDGKSRLFGFVGFKSEQAAQAAQQFFDRTFFDTSRIAVEYARKVGDGELVRPWSKYSEGSSKHQKLAEQAAPAADGGKAKPGGKPAPGTEPTPEQVDAKFAEFLQLMQPRSKSKLWANDDVLPTGAAAAPPAGKGPRPGVKAADVKKAAAKGKAAAKAAKAAAAGSSEDEAQEEASEGDDEYQDLAGGAAGAASGSEGGSSDDEEEEEEEELGGAGPRVDSGNDLDYLRSRQLAAPFDEDDDDAFLRRAGLAPAAAAEDSGDATGSGTDGDDDEEEEEEDEGGSSEEEGGDPARDPTLRGDQSGVGTSGAAAADAGSKQRRAAKLAAAMGLELPAGAAAEPEAMDVDAPAQQQQQQQQQPPGQQQQPGQQPDAVAPEDAESVIQDTGRLFLRNLAYSAGEAELRERFSAFGPVEEVHVVLDKLSKRSKGIAYVLFTVPEDAVRAYRELDGQIFQGRLLHILPARKPPSQETQAAAAAKEGASFKDQREKERRADAGARSGLGAGAGAGRAAAPPRRQARPLHRLPRCCAAVRPVAPCCTRAPAHRRLPHTPTHSHTHSPLPRRRQPQRVERAVPAC